jgi:hypothetical protein
MTKYKHDKDLLDTAVVGVYSKYVKECIAQGKEPSRETIKRWGELMALQRVKQFKNAA